jgi:hypothetical protein
MHASLLPLRRHILMVVAVASFATACAVSDPRIDTSDESQVTYDGLYPVTGGSADAAWARPGVDLSRYSKIKLQGVGIEYRPGGESGRLYYSRTTEDYYAVTQKQKDAFEALVKEAFLKELGRSEHFTIVEEAGPEVLLVRGGLLDVVSYIPPEPIGASEIFLSRVGEATLVLELRDSVTDTIIARAVDRRAAENTARGFSRSNRVSNSAELRRMVNAWARLLRERLDSYGATTAGADKN